MSKRSARNPNQYHMRAIYISIFELTDIHKDA